VVKIDAFKTLWYVSTTLSGEIRSYGKNLVQFLKKSSRVLSIEEYA
jgi:hypothetical protein